MKPEQSSIVNIVDINWRFKSYRRCSQSQCTVLCQTIDKRPRLRLNMSIWKFLTLVKADSLLA